MTTLPRFKFAGYATIRHLNVRKEGQEGEKALAVDVKFEGVAVGELCHYFDERLHHLFFDVSASGAIARGAFLEPVGFRNELEDCLLTVEGIEFHGVKLKGFKLLPVDGGMVTLTFTASFQPTANEVAVLARKVADEVSVIAEQRPGLFDIDPLSGAAEAAKNLDDLARSQGSTVDVIDNSGKTVATFGKRRSA